MSKVQRGLVSRATAARMLGVHPRTLDRWRADKLHLPFYEIGDQIKYDPHEVEALKAARRVPVHGFPGETAA